MECEVKLNFRAAIIFCISEVSEPILFAMYCAAHH